MNEEILFYISKCEFKNKHLARQDGFIYINQLKIWVLPEYDNYKIKYHTPGVKEVKFTNLVNVTKKYINDGYSKEDSINLSKIKFSYVWNLIIGKFEHNFNTFLKKVEENL